MRKIILVAVLAVAFLLTGTAARADYGSGTLGNWQTWSHGVLGNPATADALIVGDSITTGSAAETQAEWTARGRTLAVDYWSGRPITACVDHILARGTAIPPVVIVACGTNDIFDPPVVAAQINRLEAGLPTGTKLYVVDVYASRTKYPVTTQIADIRNTGWVNMQIVTACTAPCVVVPWYVWFASVPGRTTQYLSDGVHPIDGAGDRFRAAAIANKVLGAMKR